MTKYSLFFSSLAIAAVSITQASTTYLWWEAENASNKTNAEVERFPTDSPEGRVLSDQARIVAEDANSEAMQLTYQQEVPSSGQYNLWVRKFWKHGPFKWQINDGEWNTCGRDIALHAGSYISKFESTNWVFLGEVTLEEPTFTLSIESLDNKGWLDCFLLTSEPFLPRGRLKPDEPTTVTKTGMFAWDPKVDTIAQQSFIDLSFLNEEVAGQNGYIQRNGKEFTLGNGETVRFWMTQARIDNMHPIMVDRHAQEMAKYGINMVRLYFLDIFKIWRSGNKELFEKKLDGIHYTVAALKEQGIYTYFGHMFWDTHVDALSDEDLPGLKKGQPATAALFFNEPLQELYVRWISDVMTPVNPYTGISLAEDPAVAVLEVQNESNTLFWTLNPDNLPSHTRELIEKAFGDFAAKRYGSVGKAIAHWGDAVDGDEPEAGKAGFVGAYYMTTAGAPQHPKRSADQIEFLTKAQYDLYAEMKTAFRDMGIKKMIAGSNWKTADPSTLGPLEHYSYTAVDMVNKNEYFSPKKLEDSRGYAVDVDDSFVSLSAMRAPEAAGVLMIAQQAEWPYLIIENNWDNPNVYRAEWPFLVATYGRMAGVDAWNFFDYDSALWLTSQGVFSTNSPIIKGQYPAYALMYRRGDVQEGPPAVVEHVKLQDLYENNPIALPEVQYKDFVWKATLGGDPKVDYESKIDPRGFFTGPVYLHLGEERSHLETANFDELIDTDRKVIHNTNEQLLWNYGEGFVTVNTPASQGICGFLKNAGNQDLTDVSIESENDYGTIIVVSMDAKPITQSDRLLIQAATREKLHGYETEPEGEFGTKITAMGHFPILIEEIKATVRLKNMAGRKVTALDELGYPKDQAVKTESKNGDLIITLPANSLYTIVEPSLK